ncbi:hypothetical protein B0I35DRAFT_241682 [Stachybotrys elegans]|uniref:PLL-like beta propeller domain-containing protein n=1 Tax=Stachybotrys elegans TaxID=80388 RepID=A0A8K0SPX8_9HYPO|nr:hypothetical protein B0I35DRAFT_241682 [Stachybotrys elegans]
MARPHSFGDGLPEVVPSTGPEVAIPQGIHSAMMEPDEGLHVVEPRVGSDQKNLPDKGGDREEKILADGRRKGLFGWSRRKTWIVAGVVAFIVIAIAVGVSVGVVVGGSRYVLTNDATTMQLIRGLSSQANHLFYSSSSSDDTQNNGSDAPSTAPGGDDRPATTSSSDIFGTPTSFPEAPTASDSACYGTICPSVLAAAQPDENRSTVLLFGLGDNGEYWVRETDGERWAGDWESMGGDFRSQPAAISVISGRVEVFGVDGDLRMRTKSYRGGFWDTGWTNLEGRCYSPPVLCRRGDALLHVWTLSGSQELAYKSFLNGSWEPEPEASWRRSQDSPYFGSSPAVACDEGRMDILAYGESQSPYELITNTLNYTESLSVPVGYEMHGGDFRGDPVAVAVGSDETHFFGLDGDGDMYHGWWVNETPMELDGPRRIGSEFESVPSVLVTGGERLDVVAVGTDGRLKHNAMIDGAWGDWESLGGFFYSAPLVLRLDDDIVAVFGIGPEGEIIHGTWEIDDGSSWRNGRWFTDGGSFSRRWHRSGPA